MDEPDAHLHPELTQYLLSVLVEGIIEQHHLKVILSTHRPTTIALSPRESVFEMSAYPTSIRPATNINRTIQLLTASIVDIHPSIRFVIVEDQKDVEFYGSAYRQLVYDKAIDEHKSLVVVHAGRNHRNDSSGGCNEVRKWSTRLREAGLSPQIIGVIDGDSGAQERDGVLVLPRYCIENFFVDPICIFSVLNDADLAIQVDDISIPKGRSQDLVELPVGKLQQIADTILTPIEHRLGITDAALLEKVDEVYACGVVVKLPNWLRTCNGKLILGAVQEQYGAEIVNRKSLQSAFDKLGLIPNALRNLLTKIQAST